MKSGIYQIVNSLNNKSYVGSAINIKRRWYAHTLSLNKNKHRNIYLQRAWSKYWFPEEVFKFSVLEYCEKEKLLEREQFYLDSMIPEYNINRIAGNSLGFKHTEEAKVKMSEIGKNRKFSNETRLRMSMARTGKKQPLSYFLKVEIKKEAFLMFWLDHELRKTLYV